ncbi:MAG TPA: type VI secretion system tube protein TssD, partial [Hymenobacter sp.]
MPSLDAEIQVAGHCEPLDTFSVDVRQGIDRTGRPNRGVLVRPIRVTLTGYAAVLAFFTQWGVEDHMRRSGQIVVYENEQTRWRLTFYDAWCVRYHSLFRPGTGNSAYQLTLFLSPAAVDINGAHIERHTDLWWEKSGSSRFNALTKPADPLPSLSLRAALSLPGTIQVPSPTLSPITGAPQRPK